MRALAALAFVAIYGIALGTAPGRRLDALPVETDVGTGQFVQAMQQLLDPIGWLTVGAASIALVLWALRRRGLGCAAGIAGGLIGTYLSLLVLEAFFARIDPVDGEALRRLGRSSYPSGHAAAVAALCMGAVAVRPRHLRWLVVGACAFAATVGVALVVIHAHYPSDVLGGWLLALLWSTGTLSSRY